MIEVSGVYAYRHSRGSVGVYKIIGGGDFFSAAAKTLSFHYKKGYRNRWKDPSIWLDIRCGYSINTHMGYTAGSLNLEEDEDDHNLRQVCYLIEYYVDYWEKARLKGDFLLYLKHGLRGFIKVLTAFERLTGSGKAAEVIEDCKSLFGLLESCPSMQDIAPGDRKLLEPFKSHPMSALLMYAIYGETDSDDEYYGEAPWLWDSFTEQRGMESPCIP